MQILYAMSAAHFSSLQSFPGIERVAISGRRLLLVVRNKALIYICQRNAKWVEIQIVFRKARTSGPHLFSKHSLIRRALANVLWLVVPSVCVLAVINRRAGGTRTNRFASSEAHVHEVMYLCSDVRFEEMDTSSHLLLAFFWK